MIDGFYESYEDNILIFKFVVDVCMFLDIFVEVELGKVGGKEDDLDGGDGGVYIDLLEVKEFVERIGVLFLVVVIGMVYGLYKGELKFDLDRLFEIRDVVLVLLVLYGGFGILDEVIKEFIKRGICKVNYVIELRIVYSNGVKNVFNFDLEVIDFKKYGKKGLELVKDFVKSRMEVCGCVGKVIEIVKC